MIHYTLAAEKTKGSALVAINEWSSFFNVRTKPVQVLAGQSIQIKIKPTVHVASDEFKKLGVDQRKCLFPHERTVNNKAFLDRSNPL